MSDKRTLTNDQFNKKYPILSERQRILKYGTSEGAIRAWDSRGRGQKKPQEEKRGAQVAVGAITKPDGTKILINVDGTKMRTYIDKVQEMKDIADAIGNASVDVNATSKITELQRKLTVADLERSAIHEDLANDAAKQLIKEHPEYPGGESGFFAVARQTASSMADKIISHIGKSFQKYGTSEGAVRAWDSRGRGTRIK